MHNFEIKEDLEVGKKKKKATYLNSRNINTVIIQLVKNLPAMQENPFGFLGRDDPLEKR